MDPSTVSLPLGSVDGHRVPQMTSTGVGTEDPPSPLGQGPLVIIQEVAITYTLKQVPQQNQVTKHS